MRALLAVALGLVAPAAGQSGSAVNAAGHAVFELLRYMRAEESPPQPAGKPPDPMDGMAEAITSQCKEVPALIAEEWQNSGCHANATMMMDVLMYYARTLVDPGATVTHEMKSHFIDGSHNSLNSFCTQPKCAAGTRKFMEHYTKCYADALCGVVAASGQGMMFKMCQPVLTKMITNALQTEMSTLCMKEPGKDVYCSEVDIMLFADSPDCYREVHSPVMGCSPRCQQVWQGVKRENPECAENLADKVIRYQHMALNVVQTLQRGQGGMLSAVSARPFGEVCSNHMGFAGGTPMKGAGGAPMMRFPRGRHTMPAMPAEMAGRPAMSPLQFLRGHMKQPGYKMGHFGKSQFQEFHM